MDASTEISEPTATQETPASDAPPPGWQLAALLQPAFVPLDGWLPILPRLWLDWAVQSVTGALEKTLDRSTTTSLLDDPKASHEPVFGISFTLPELTSTGLLTLDLPCARVIVDSLQNDLTQLRGAGPLTETELGLLEYATLATLDRVQRSGPSEIVVRGFHDAKSTRGLLDQAAASGTTQISGITLRMRCAGREGTTRLHLPGLGSLTAQLPSGGGKVVVGSSLIDLRVALPPVTLSSTDAAAIQPRDVLLLGVTDLQSFGATCQLATSRGWSVASATIVRDSPTVIDVRCGSFVLGTLPAAPSGSGQIVLNPLVGLRRMTTEHLERWQTGTMLDLPKDLILPVEFIDGPQRIAQGELVRIDGEIGVRIVRVTRSAAKGSAS